MKKGKDMGINITGKCLAAQGWQEFFGWVSDLAGANKNGLSGEYQLKTTLFLPLFLAV
ncbi:hypothetical protein [Desulfobotulus mexicanus]|uniref:hypothetical protein n=1 Tax=Desulfobotulus mexicanus TaxID=2586642 RepID=UPI0015D0F536|nr:hypothetical protein [Desulfobotulus mexicanus]